MILSMCTFAVAAVNFANQVYDIVEGTGLVQLMLTLSNPSSYNNTIRVLNADGSATGKLLASHMLYMCNLTAVNQGCRYFRCFLHRSNRRCSFAKHLFIYIGHNNYTHYMHFLKICS